MNVAHQLGGSLGFGVLVVVFTAAGSGKPDAGEILAHQVAAALTAGTAMMAIGLAIVFALIVRPKNTGKEPRQTTQ